MTDELQKVLDAAAHEREVHLIAYGRKTGKPHSVTIRIATDRKRLFVRSGEGLRRPWSQNLLARGEGELPFVKATIEVKPRLVTDAAEARAVSAMYKCGPSLKASKPSQPLTPGEQATFELLPAEDCG